jgi:hypothetical protein
MASRSSSSASSFDDSYFYQNYVPLSNLPTPPLMYSNTSTSRQPSESLFPNEPLSPALLGKLLLDHYFRMLISSPDLPFFQALQHTSRISSPPQRPSSRPPRQSFTQSSPAPLSQWRC